MVVVRLCVVVVLAGCACYADGASTKLKPKARLGMGKEHERVKNAKGLTMVVSSAKRVFGSIHKGDALVWPNEDWQYAAGEDAWKDMAPGWEVVAGMKGKVVFEWFDKLLLEFPSPVEDDDRGSEFWGEGVNGPLAVVARSGLEEPDTTYFRELWDQASVVFLDDAKKFASWRRKHPKFAALFYLPYCQHCKKYSKGFAATAQILRMDPDYDVEKMPLAVIDCHDNLKDGAGEICYNLKVIEGYPQIRYYTVGEWKTPQEKQLMLGSEYLGSRDPRLLAGFLKRELADFKFKPDPSLPMAPCPWTTGCANTVALNDDHWQSYREKHPRMLTYFYGKDIDCLPMDSKSCMTVMPEFIDASKHVGRSMPFSVIDCDGSGYNTCAELNIHEYPDVRFFESKDLAKTPAETETGVSMQRSDMPPYIASGEILVYSEIKLNDAARNSTDGKMNLRKLRVKELKKMLRMRGLKCPGCADKSDYVSILEKNLNTPILKKKPMKKGASGLEKAAYKDSKGKKQGQSLMQEKRLKQAAAHLKTVRTFWDFEYSEGTYHVERVELSAAEEKKKEEQQKLEKTLEDMDKSLDDDDEDDDELEVLDEEALEAAVVKEETQDVKEICPGNICPKHEVVHLSPYQFYDFARQMKWKHVLIYLYDGTSKGNSECTRCTASRTALAAASVAIQPKWKIAAFDCVWGTAPSDDYDTLLDPKGEVGTISASICAHHFKLQGPQELPYLGHMRNGKVIANVSSAEILTAQKITKYVKNYGVI